MPVKIVFLDCDGTLTKVRSSWEYLHRRLGLWNNHADEYQGLFREGKIDYAEFCRRDALLWKGLRVSTVIDVIGEIPYQDHAKETIESFKGMGIATFIISTGLSFLVNRVRSELSIGGAVSNELLNEGGVLTGEVKINVDYEKKGPLIGAILDRSGFCREEACAIGDGEGDIGMFGAVALPIGFNPHDAVLPHIKHSCYSGSLLDIVDYMVGCK